MSQPLILVADDEPKIRRLLSINLASLGYEVICAVDGPSALQVFEDHQPDLVLLDIMMPGLDGYDVLTRIRRTSNCAVILLTAKDQIEDKIRAFDLGADDYLPKPFALEELFGRVRAVLRRLSTTQKGLDQEIVNGSLKLNTASRQTWFEDKEIKLSAVEFSMLEYFMRHVNSVLVHEQIIAHVWGNSQQQDVQYLRVTLARLRQKTSGGGHAGRLRHCQPFRHRLSNGNAAPINTRQRKYILVAAVLRVRCQISALRHFVLEFAVAVAVVAVQTRRLMFAMASHAVRVRCIVQRIVRVVVLLVLARSQFGHVFRCAVARRAIGLRRSRRRLLSMAGFTRNPFMERLHRLSCVHASRHQHEGRSQSHGNQRCLFHFGTPSSQTAGI
jgi:two-component system KDP operon response regulator KdpE